ncbi:MAG: competence protein CoiA [Muribaculaceae bacterium]|nr:competence protein CoiA [Muribaculaceae bacterium]
MENEFRREQHYAVSKGGILSHIKDAHNDPEDYYCPHCGCRMIKRCGSIRAWHFAHDWHDDNVLQTNCSYETYLHGYAKLRLKQWFDESNSIMLHYVKSYVCKQYDTCKLIQNENCRKNEDKSCDLKQLFNNCSIESTVKGANVNYRADLLLTSDKDSSRHLLIEIKVSHGCTEKKKASGVPIIEFDVASEEDVDYIISHEIKESDNVRYYGFDLIKKDKKIPSALPLQKFILYKSGKTFCKKIKCQSITYRYRTSLFELTTIISEEDYWCLNLYGLMKARERGFKFPNCYLCEHYYKAESNSCKCKINDAEIKKGSDALECGDYIFKPSAFEKISSLQFDVLDIWSQTSK